MTAAPLTAWEGAPLASWRARWCIPELLVLASAGSTNDLVREAALAGALPGTTAIADFQAAGRGRLGRSWSAPPGTALLMSVLCRPAAGGAAETAGALPLRVGLAVAEALSELTGPGASIKWPNDVLLDGRKVAGILCEAGAGFVVIGIGLNVLQQPPDFPPELAGRATSIRMATGWAGSRATLAGAILERLRPLFTAPHRPLDRAEMDRFASLDALAGQRITIDDHPAGTAAGIDPLGALLVEQGGERQSFHAGTVGSAP